MIIKLKIKPRINKLTGRKLYGIEVDHIAVVDRPANRRPLLIMKREANNPSEKTKEGL